MSASSTESQSMNSLNYIVSAQKPSAVTVSCVGHFTGPESWNLIIGKCSRLEIRLLSAEGSKPLLELPIYGGISMLQLFRAKGEPLDFLFVLTERDTYFVLAWDAQTREVYTRASQDLSTPVKRLCPMDNLCPSDNRLIDAAPCPSSLIGLHMYDDNLELIPINVQGGLEDPFRIRFHMKVPVLDFKFLHNSSTEPTAAVLCQDHDGSQHVKGYQIDMNRKCLLQFFILNRLDTYLRGAYMLIPVAMPLGGVLITCDQEIVYSPAESLTSRSEAVPAHFTTRAYGVLNAAEFKYLLGADDGTLYILDITRHENGTFDRLLLSRHVKTSIASTISCITVDNLILVFIGSRYGHSQLFKMENDEGCVQLQELEHFYNPGPVVDLCLVKTDGVKTDGYGKLLTCGGVPNDIPLHLVSSRIELDELAFLNVAGILGLWAIPSTSSIESDVSFIVVSFSCQTRILKVDNDISEFSDLSGFKYDRSTLFCFRSIANQVVQVTESSTILLGEAGLLDEWSYPEANFTVATGTISQILLASRSRLFYLEIHLNSLNYVVSVQTDSEVSCLDMSTVGPGGHIAAVGLWNKTVVIYSLPNLEKVTSAGEQEIPRSVLFCYLEGVSYLLCGLADGFVVEFIMDYSNSLQLHYMKRLPVGHAEVSLTLSTRNQCIYVTGHKPTIIYSVCKKLEYNLLNEGELMHVAPLNSGSSPHRLVFSNANKLGVAFVLPKIIDIPLRGGIKMAANCLSYHNQAGMVVVCTTESTDPDYSESIDPACDYVELIDPNSFVVRSRYRLQPNEHALSVISCCIGNTDHSRLYICVGTRFQPLEDDTEEGSIYVFCVLHNKTLKRLCVCPVNGAVYSLCESKRELLAGVNENILTFEWHEEAMQLSPTYSTTLHSKVLHLKRCNDYILAGDMAWANHIYVHSSHGQSLKVVGKETKQTWSSAMEFISTDSYVCSNNEYNLEIFKKNNDGVRVYESIAEFYTCDYINIFRKISVPECSMPAMLFGTANGAIGILASLSQDFFDRLMILQKHIIRVGVMSGTEHLRSRSIVDGDIIEWFFHLKYDKMKMVAASMMDEDDKMKRVVVESMMNVDVDEEKMQEKMVKFIIADVLGLRRELKETFRGIFDILVNPLS